MYLGHRSHRAFLHQLRHAPVIFAGMNLRADLRDEFLLAGDVGHRPAFGNRAGERFLAIDMASAAQRRNRRHGVRVIRRGDDHGVNVPLVKQPTEIGVRLRGGKFLLGRSQVMLIHVAQGNDVLAGHGGEIVVPLVRHADDAEVELLVGRQAPPGGPATSDPEPRYAQRGLP